MPTLNGRSHVVMLCCADGLITHLPEFEGKVVHEVRVPGGILFAKFCAENSGRCQEEVRSVLEFAVETMVSLKNPDEIVIMAHSPCGAAINLGLTEVEIVDAHEMWRERLQNSFPNILVRTLIEHHSPCGENREPHKPLAVAA
jgi:hypothetical protein